MVKRDDGNRPHLPFRSWWEGFCAWLSRAFPALSSGRGPKRGGGKERQGGKGRPERRWPIPGGWSVPLVAADLLMLLALAGAFLLCFSRIKSSNEMLDVTLKADGGAAAYRIRPSAVSDFLRSAGLQLSEGDTLSHGLDEALSDGDTVEVRRSFPVAVESGGTVQLLNIQGSGGTVGDALGMAGVDYDVDDELTHLAFEDLAPGMQIQHISVETEYDTTHKTLNYQEVVIKDDSEYEDFREVETEGSDGLKRVTQRITIKNGMEVSREIVDQTVLTPAVDEVIRVGAKIRYQTNYEGEWRRVVDRPVAGEDGWVEMTVYRATGYCTGTRTATGTRPRLGTVAVNPKIIPYGTKIWVPKYGMCTAEDTGAFRNYEEPRNNAIDLWFNTRAEAMRWGAKYNYTILVKMG